MTEPTARPAAEIEAALNAIEARNGSDIGDYKSGRTADQKRAKFGIRRWDQDDTYRNYRDAVTATLRWVLNRHLRRCDRPTAGGPDKWVRLEEQKCRARLSIKELSEAAHRERRKYNELHDATMVLARRLRRLRKFKVTARIVTMDLGDALIRKQRRRK